MGTFDGTTELRSFLTCFHNCVEYFKWDDEDKLYQLKNSLVGTAGYLLTEIDHGAELEDIIKLLELRFQNRHQTERFTAELKGRRQKYGESLQALYQDLCRLKSLAFGKSEESEFSNLYLRDVFLDAINDREMRRTILIKEPATMEEALRIACRIEAIDASGINDIDKESFHARNRLHNVEDGKRLDKNRSHSDGEELAKTGMKKQLAEMRRALNNVRQEISKQKMDGRNVYRITNCGWL